RGKTDAEARLALGRNPSLQQIAARPGADVVLQGRLEILRGKFHDVGQALALCLALLLPLIPGRHRQAGHAGQLFDRLGKAHPGLFRREAEMVPRHSTAEAVIDAPPVIGMTARAFLAVKRAARPHIALGRLALALVPKDVLAHHLRYRQALTDLVEKLIGKAHELLRRRSYLLCHGLSSFPQPPAACLSRGLASLVQ